MPIQEYRAAIQENPQDESAICALAEIVETRRHAAGIRRLLEGCGARAGDANAKLGLVKVLD
jgi:hypothetical protein